MRLAGLGLVFLACQSSGQPDNGPRWTDTDTSTPAPVVLAGNVYAFDLDTVVFAEPDGVAPLVGELLHIEWLLGVVSEESDSLRFLSARGKSWNGDNIRQDECVSTVAFDSPADFVEKPMFYQSIERIDIGIAAAPIVIQDAEISGKLSSGSIANVILQGQLDVTALQPMVAGDPCDLLLTFDTACGPCPLGGDTCVFIKSEPFEGSLVSELVLNEVTSADVEADIGCN